MSYATLYRMPVEGPLEEVKEYGNAFGGAMRIWESLFQKWIPAEGSVFMWLMGRDGKEFWALAEDDRLPEADRIVLASTYDKAVVPSEMLERFVEALRDFDARHPAGGEMVSHVQAWANDIEAMISEGMEGFVGICFNQTSVVDDIWTIFEGDAEDDRLYDASRDEGHWLITDIGAEHA